MPNEKGKKWLELEDAIEDELHDIETDIEEYVTNRLSEAVSTITEKAREIYGESE